MEILIITMTITIIVVVVEVINYINNHPSVSSSSIIYILPKYMSVSNPWTLEISLIRSSR